MLLYGNGTVPGLVGAVPLPGGHDPADRAGPGRAWRSCSAWRSSGAGSGAPTSPSCPRPWPPPSRSCSIGQQTTTGGTNGLNGFRGFFGYNLYDPVNKRMLFFIAAGGAAGHGGRRAGSSTAVPVRRAAGRRAGPGGAGPVPRLRPGQRQVRRLRGRRGDGRRSAARCSCRSSASSRPPTSAWCPRSPSSSASRSAAGPPCSARCSARSRSRGRRPRCREQFPSFWTYFQGALFILVVAFLPGGLASLARLGRGAAARPRRQPTARRRRPPTDAGAPDAPRAARAEVACRQA